ncbi:MAG: hypothetical protein K0S36_1159 [Nitrosospira multiformis]|nr:hypothetical protein [Nitrosospira multiformis]
MGEKIESRGTKLSPNLMSTLKISALLLGMQLHHCGLIIAFCDEGPDCQAVVYGRVDQRRFFLARRLQYVIHDGMLFSRMADADPQAPELSGTEMRDNVFQTVVPAQSPVELQPGDARGQIQFVVHYEHLFRLNPVETAQCSHCPSAGVHVSLGIEQPGFRIAPPDTRAQAVKLRIGLQRDAQLIRQANYPPGARIMACGRIFPTWIAEADDELH